MESKVRLTNLALLLLVASVAAAAALGEDASSAPADQAQMPARLNHGRAHAHRPRRTCV